MHIEVVDRSIPVAVVVAQGRLDASSAPDLRSRCDQLLGDGTERLVIDLSAIEFCDSAGLASLVGALKRTRAAGGDTKLVAPSHDGVWRILRLTRFERVFDIKEDVDTAVGAFAT